MEQFLYDKKALCKRYGRERRTIVRTIKAAGLDPKRRLYTDYEVKTFIDPARSLFDQRVRAARIHTVLTSPDFDADALQILTSNNNACSSNCWSRERLSDLFSISLDTVKRSLSIAGLDPLRDDFTTEEVLRFTKVRTFFGEGKRAKEITRIMQPAKGKQGSSTVEEEVSESSKKTYTKRAIAAKYGISYDTVKRTLKACDLDTRRSQYTEEELTTYFEKARGLFTLGYSSKGVRTYFRLKPIEQISSTQQ